MKISNTMCVQDIIEQFNDEFNFLKIEFYKKHHHDSEGSPLESQLLHSTLLKELNSDLRNEEIVLFLDMTVSEFEQMMFNRFKFNIQVFRKSDNLWLQTSSTDQWTLEKQNGKGQRSITSS